MTKIEKAELEAKGIKVTICKPRKARGFESFSNFKSNRKRMKGYKKFAIQFQHHLHYWSP